jgi:uncharacterized protein YciI
MPAWNDYKAEAKSRGALALEVYCVVSTPAGDMSKVKQCLPDHLAYQAQLELSGALMFAGPLSDLSGELMEGAGQIIYRASTLEEATELASADPMHAEGARTFTVRRWLINEGSLQLNVNLAAQTVAL